jgi:tRNA pseudouridine(38-40) synthase
VEGEIDRGISRRGLPLSRAPFDVASRTDRGVSAVGNAIIFRSDLDGPTLLRALNGISPFLFFRKATPVEESLRVRAATRRVYRYFEPRAPTSLTAWNRAARLFSGEVDVRSLGRGLPRESPQWRTVDHVKVRRTPAGLEVEVVAPSFVWGMVRKIVGALREVDAGHLDLARLRAALEGRSQLPLPLAEPEPLVLWDVVLPVRWKYDWSGPTRYQVRGRISGRDEVRTRGRVLEALGRGMSLGKEDRARLSRRAPSVPASERS